MKKKEKLGFAIYCRNDIDRKYADALLVSIRHGSDVPVWVFTDVAFCAAELRVSEVVIPHVAVRDNNLIELPCSYIICPTHDARELLDGANKSFHFANCEYRTKEFIIEHYVGFDILQNCGERKMVQVYNDFVEYYMVMAGRRNQWKYISPVRVKDRYTVGFYHVSMMNHWREVVREQMNLIVQSGLHNKVNRIYIGAVGSKEMLRELVDMIKGTKFVVAAYSDNLQAYEYPTINLVKQYSKTHENYDCFYIHTKGVSQPAHREGGDYWRQFMNYFNLEKWRDCKDGLLENELAGCGWRDESIFNRHYSGNFWWARGEYIKSLPDIDTLNQEDRFQAEFWIGKGNPKVLNLSSKKINYEHKPNYK